MDGETRMEEEQLSIRLAKPPDAKEIERVLHVAYEQYRGRVQPPLQALSATARKIAAEMKIPGAGYLIAEVGDNVVGVVRFRRLKAGKGRVMELARLAVDPAYRCFGLGRRLMMEAEALAVRAGVWELRGHVRASLSTLLGFYGSLGFRPLGRLSKPGYPRYLVVVGKRIGPHAQQK